MIYKNELKVNFTGKTTDLVQATKKASNITSRAAQNFGNRWRDASRSASSAAKKSINKISQASKKIANSVAQASSIAIAAVAGFSVHSLKEFMKFEKGMKQVWTLTNQTKEEFKGMSNEVLKLMLRGGGATEPLTKGLYDAISASVKAKDAIKFLALAQDIALASATDVATAVDGLTSVINAYKKSLGTTKLKQAQKAAEIFFNTIKYGKTTFAELAPEMGRIAPIAAQLGIGFDEIGAATASLTMTGGKTNATIVALRQVLISILNPSLKAVRVAKDLGISFNLQALKAKGLVNYLKYVYTATKGNTQQMTQLFGNVRALTGALGLTGNQMKKYEEIQNKVSSETGNFTAAVLKMKNTTAFAWDRMVAYGRVKSIQFGQGLAEAFKGFYDTRPEIMGFTDDMQKLGKILGTFVIANFFRLKAIVLQVAAIFYNFKEILGNSFGDLKIIAFEIAYLFKKMGLEIKYVFLGIGTSITKAFSLIVENILYGLAKVYEALPGEKAKMTSLDLTQQAVELNLGRRLKASKQKSGYKKELAEIRTWRDKKQEGIRSKRKTSPMSQNLTSQAVQAWARAEEIEKIRVPIKADKKLAEFDRLEKEGKRTPEQVAIYKKQYQASLQEQKKTNKLLTEMNKKIKTQKENKEPARIKTFKSLQPAH